MATVSTMAWHTQAFAFARAPELVTMIAARAEIRNDNRELGHFSQEMFARHG